MSAISPNVQVAENDTDIQNAGRAFDLFIGFIYATTIGLVIRTSYRLSDFNSVLPVSLTLLLLIFFAYDWLARFTGRRAMSGRMLTTRATLLLRLILELAIVYFLLLGSLKFVEGYANSDASPILQSLGALSADKPLPCFMAMFALLSGVWNAVMIWLSVDVNWKTNVSPLFTGHLPESLLRLFPDMKAWLDKDKEFRESKLQELAVHANRQSQQPQDGGSGVAVGQMILDRAVTIRRELGAKYFFRSLVSMQALRFLVPYGFAFHVVALNVVLSVFLFSSVLFMGGECLWANYPVFTHWLVLAIAVLGFALCLVLFVRYFTYRRLWCERIGCLFLFLTMLLFYSLCRSVCLITLIVMQQCIADFIMTVYFKPHADVVGGAGNTEEGAQL